MGLYNIALQVPIVSKTIKKVSSRFDTIENENRILARQVVDLRIQLKALKGEKINVVFLCHRPAVWRSTKSIYEYLRKNPRVKCSIVTFPQLTPSGEYDDEKADEYFDGNEDWVGGFNKESQTFMDLKTLEPDYVFYQQGYNSIYVREYRSNVVSSYAKICYLSYFAHLEDLVNNGVADECYQMDFLRDVSMFFAQTRGEEKWLQDNICKHMSVPMKVFLTGYPKYDNLEEYKEGDSQAWKGRTWQGKFRIIWTPRWTTNENACHFFTYKDKLLEFCQRNPTVDFLFRPHPQSWVEWEHTGELPKDKAVEYKQRYNSIDNAFIDEQADYLRTFYHSDCLVTDTSSVMPEYFLTGKPIVYCYNDRSRNQYQYNKGMSRAFYWVKTWEELEKTLDMLKQGDDPLREKRDCMISEFLREKGNAGKRIGDIILHDAFR